MGDDARLHELASNGQFDAPWP